jgi:hypothetical protein
MTANDVRPSNPLRLNYLEFAVPLIAFGVTGFGILLWSQGFTVDFQYVSVGCTISSFILAYLAWIQPRKDIVALSTPIYGIVFLSTPIEAAAGAVLQLLYAAGLTILLLRLKHRFGTESSGPVVLSPDEPLGIYRNRISADIPGLSSSDARTAARVFIRFAEGEYEQARSLASDAINAHDKHLPALLEQTYAIIVNQAGHLIEGGPVPVEYPAFSSDHQPHLFHPVREDLDNDRAFSIQLENALILLYVVALGSAENEIQQTLDQLLPFARRLGVD